MRGVAMGHIGRFWIWRHNTLSIYLHFGDAVQSDLSEFAMKCDGLLKKLRAIADTSHQVSFGMGGDSIKLEEPPNPSRASGGQPPLPAKGDISGGRKTWTEQGNKAQRRLDVGDGISPRRLPRARRLCGRRKSLLRLPS